MVTWHVLPEQAGSLHAVTVDPVHRVRLRVTSVPLLKVALHSVAPAAPFLIVQRIPVGLDITCPLPVPAPATIRGSCGATSTRYDATLLPSFLSGWVFVGSTSAKM